MLISWSQIFFQFFARLFHVRSICRLPLILGQSVNTAPFPNCCIDCRGRARDINFRTNTKSRIIISRYTQSHHCTLYTVRYTLYTVHCTLCTVHCTFNTVHSTHSLRDGQGSFVTDLTALLILNDLYTFVRGKLNGEICSFPPSDLKETILDVLSSEVKGINRSY